MRTGKPTRARRRPGRPTPRNSPGTRPPHPIVPRDGCGRSLRPTTPHAVAPSILPMLNRSTKTLLAAGVLAIAAAAPAAADSVAYVKGGDVWLTTTDGARQ